MPKTRFEVKPLRPYKAGARDDGMNAGLPRLHAPGLQPHPTMRRHFSAATVTVPVRRPFMAATAHPPS
jgi:hypothetical protein